MVFEGQGGESIAVEMARGDDADGALGAIDRAKALLVQTATFEMPVDRIGGFNRTPESGNVRGRRAMSIRSNIATATNLDVAEAKAARQANDNTPL